MRTANHIVLCAVAVALSALSAVVRAQAAAEAFPKQAAPYLAAYRWGAANANGGAGANEAYAKWLGRPVVWAEDFEPTEHWADNIEGGGWQRPTGARS